MGSRRQGAWQGEDSGKDAGKQQSGARAGGFQSVMQECMGLQHEREGCSGRRARRTGAPQACRRARLLP